MASWVILIIAAMLLVAYANGANDNFKGVATLFGIGILNGQAHWGMIRTILLAWVLTLPFAGISAGIIYVALSQLAA